MVVDALVLKVRRDEAVRATRALIVSGSNTAGHREVLGLRLGDRESAATWSAMFPWLKQRGLPGIEVLVADAHAGLVPVAQRHFQGVRWQRGQGHLARNVCGRTPRHLRAQMAAGRRRLLQAEEVVAARTAFAAVVTALEGKAARALEVVEEGLADALAVLVLPAKDQGRLRTTNMLERRNEALRRRERVRRMFPHEASAGRLLGAVLADQQEAWSPGQRYVDMTESFEWQATPAPRARRGLREVRCDNAQRRKAHLQHILDLTVMSFSSEFC